MFRIVLVISNLCLQTKQWNLTCSTNARCDTVNTFFFFLLFSSIYQQFKILHVLSYSETLFLVSIYDIWLFPRFKQHFFRCSRPFFSFPHGAFLPTSTLLRVICKCVSVNLAAPMEEGHIARRYAFDIVRDVWSSYAWDEKRFSPASEKEKRWKWRGDGSRLNCIVFFFPPYVHKYYFINARVSRLASKSTDYTMARAGEIFEQILPPLELLLERW